MQTRLEQLKAAYADALSRNNRREMRLLSEQIKAESKAADTAQPVESTPNGLIGDIYARGRSIGRGPKQRQRKRHRRRA